MIGKRFLYSLLIVVFFTSLVFRQYILFNKVPFPGNLLLSYYQPWASYSWDGYIKGPPAKPIGFDNLRMFYPLRKIVVGQLAKKQIPLWNPYSFSGNTILGAYQSAVFHPLSWLFLLLPQIDAWSIIIVISPLFVFISMYLFLRDLRISDRLSFFGSVVYAFSGIMIVWWEEMFMSVYSIIPLPLALMAVNRLFRKVNHHDVLLLVFSFVFSILSGYFQTTFYLFLLTCLYVLFKFLVIEKKKYIPLILIIVCCFVSLLISGIQLTPALEAYTWSARGVTDVKAMFEMFFAQASHLITFIAPDFFGNPATHNYYSNSFYHEKVIWIGIPALILVLYNCISIYKQRTNYENIFFTLLGIIFLSFIFSLPTSWYILYGLHLPFLSEMTPTRISYLVSFCFAVSATYGLDQYEKENNSKKAIIISIFLILVLIFLSFYAFNQFPKADNRSQISVRNLVVPSIIMCISCFWMIAGKIFQKFKKVPYFIFVFLSLAGSLYFANKYLYFSKKSYVYPDTAVISKLKSMIGIDRYWSVGNAYINRNFSNYFGIQSPEGYESFNIKRYSELVYESHNHASNVQKPERADAFLFYADNLKDVVQNRYPLRLMELLGVKYIIVKHDNLQSNIYESNGFRKIWNDDAFDIYIYSLAFPRYFLVSRYEVIENNTKILNRIYDSTFDLRNIVILEKNPNVSLSVNATGSASLKEYSPNKVIFETITDNSMLFFISDNFYPGWTAYIDDKPREIFRANYSFRSVIIPPGRHKLEFIFQPLSLKIGFILSCIGASSLLGLTVFIYIYTKKHK